MFAVFLRRQLKKKNVFYPNDFIGTVVRVPVNENNHTVSLNIKLYLCSSQKS